MIRVRSTHPAYPARARRAEARLVVAQQEQAKRRSLAIWEQKLNIQPDTDKRLDRAEDIAYGAALISIWIVAMIILSFPVINHGVQALGSSLVFAGFFTYAVIMAWQRTR